MRIVVCVRQSADGEINPFDACGYETALRIPDAEVILLSMGPERTAAFLENLTRLGAKKAVLLTDKAFAGADTLATAYTLSLALMRLQPDMVICGRQSVDGDTGQVGPSLAVNTGYGLLTNAMAVEVRDNTVWGQMRNGEIHEVSFPAIVTVEKSLNLRLPRLRSKTAPLEVLDAAALGADTSRTGLTGSPTRVVKAYENTQGRRRCTKITPADLPGVLASAVDTHERKSIALTVSEKKLSHVWIVGESPREMAETVAERLTLIPLEEPKAMAERIRKGKPDAVLWGSDAESKAVAPQVAALLRTGLCADCTALESDGSTLYMIRPACSGNVIAKIRCMTTPPMATVRTAEPDQSAVVLGIGYGAREHSNALQAIATSRGWEVAATRKMVDSDCLSYDRQVGLTGKNVSPAVYLAVGISGAVHHIVGMQKSGTVIAVNPDKDAPIFDYADYGVVGTVAEVLKELEL